MAEFFLEYEFLLSVGCVDYSIHFYVCLYFQFNNEKRMDIVFLLELFFKLPHLTNKLRYLSFKAKNEYIKYSYVKHGFYHSDVQGLWIISYCCGLTLLLWLCKALCNITRVARILGGWLGHMQMLLNSQNCAIKLNLQFLLGFAACLGTGIIAILLWDKQWRRQIMDHKTLIQHSVTTGLF